MLCVNPGAAGLEGFHQVRTLLRFEIDGKNIQKLADFKSLRAVHGNVDGGSLRGNYPEFLSFECEQVSVLLTHIGGYPGRYWPEAKRKIIDLRPDLFVCGHSHILKVQFDQNRKLKNLFGTTRTRKTKTG